MASENADQSVPRGARACARVGRGRPGLIRGCLPHTSRRCPDLLSGCRVVCGGDKHERCAWLQQAGDAGCGRAARPVGAHAGPGCPGGGAFASCDDVRCRLAPRCRASACAIGPTWEDQVDMGCTWRSTEDVPSPPHITSPQPGDHSPCLHCLSMQITIVCVGACVHTYVRVHAYVRVYIWAMLVCGRQCGCGCACMGACACVRACMCVRTCVLAHIAANFPELACSHDKRCTPTLSGITRRSGSRMRPNAWLFHGRTRTRRSGQTMPATFNFIVTLTQYKSN